MKIQIDQDKTHDAWLSVKFIKSFKVEDPRTGEHRDLDQVEYRANVKFDGCVHFNRDYHASTGGDEDTDYLHICDLDEVIDILTTVRMMAKEHFGDHWQ